MQWQKNRWDVSLVSLGLKDIGSDLLPETTFKSRGLGFLTKSTFSSSSFQLVFIGLSRLIEIPYENSSPGHFTFQDILDILE